MGRLMNDSRMIRQADHPTDLIVTSRSESA